MRKAVRIGVDDELDLSLRPALHGLAAMLAGLAEAELAEHLGERGSLVFVDGELQKADPAALRTRHQTLSAGGRKFRRELILQQDQRTHAVGRGAGRRACAELVI